VLGVRRDWAEHEDEPLKGLVRAIYRAALWCDDPANSDALCALLARNEFLGQPEAVLRPGIARRLTAPDGSELEVDGFLTFAARAATFPWISHALWLFTQMVRWGQAPFTPQAVEAARKTYRPDLYRAALKPVGAATPSANSKVEGALRIETPVGSAAGRLSLGPDGFFDGRIFDPDRLEDYISGFSSNRQ
jgi:NitT/TauT family transport system ATP-binding protein